MKSILIALALLSSASAFANSVTTLEDGKVVIRSRGAEADITTKALTNNTNDLKVKITGTVECGPAGEGTVQHCYIELEKAAN